MQNSVLSKSLLLAALLSSLYGADITGKVVGVHDGDTLTILDSSKTQHKIRLAQIDAPESSQDFGSASKQSLSRMCYGKEAKAKVETTDRYQRSVAIVYCEGTEANLEQVKEGLAWVYRQYASDQRYFKAETAAKSAKVGLWSMSEPTPPWEYRKGKKTAQQDSKPTAQKTSSKKECGSKRTCKQMTSCAEAKFYLEECGVSALDKDKDGIPCESLCR